MRGVSCEPLLGHIHIDRLDYIDSAATSLDWVIAGGESGPMARPSHPDWFRNLRDQCKAAGVPFFFKQWGEFCPPRPELRPTPSKKIGWINIKTGKAEFDCSDVRLMQMRGEDFCAKKTLTAQIIHVGKKAAGRTLDGVTHNTFPGDL